MVTEEQRKHYDGLLKERRKIQRKSTRQTKRNYLISLAVGIVIGLIIMEMLIKADQEGIMDIDRSIWYLYGGFVLFFISYIFHIIIHETGHLIFGLLTGYKFLSFRIFSMIFYKKDGRMHKSKYAVKGTAGQCLMCPPKRREDGSFPFVMYNLGGGIANLIFSVPFIIPFVLSQSFYAHVIYMVLLSAGILMAATNIIPMNVSLPNDGMNIKSMLKDKYMREAFYLQLKVNAELSDGKSITDYSPQVFELSEAADDTNMLTAFVRLLAYYQKLSFHDYEGADKILAAIEEKSEKYQPAILQVVEAERLFFMVLQHRPPEEIASVYEHSRFFLAAAKTDISVRRVYYIYEALLTEAEKQDIMTLITKKPPEKWKECNREQLYWDFLKTAGNYPVSGEAAMNVDIVDYIIGNDTRRA